MDYVNNIKLLDLSYVNTNSAEKYQYTSKTWWQMLMVLNHIRTCVL